MSKYMPASELHPCVRLAMMQLQREIAIYEPWIRGAQVTMNQVQAFDVPPTLDALAADDGQLVHFGRDEPRADS